MYRSCVELLAISNWLILIEFGVPCESLGVILVVGNITDGSVGSANRSVDSANRLYRCIGRVKPDWMFTLPMDRSTYQCIGKTHKFSLSGIKKK